MLADMPLAPHPAPSRGLVSAVLAAAASLAACTAQQLYGAGQSWQRQECHRLPDADQRQRCLASSALSYDEYRRQAEAVKPAR